MLAFGAQFALTIGMDATISVTVAPATCVCTRPRSTTPTATPSYEGKEGRNRKLHADLFRLNHLRLRPRYGDDEDLEFHDEYDLRLRESRFVEEERGGVIDWVQTMPTAPEHFLSWFEQLRQDGPGQRDALFPWLAHEASLEQMRWFLAQEVAGEAGFDDLVALTQLKMPRQAKLEMARNYWDEMGRGNSLGMHGPLLDTLCATLALKVEPDKAVWPSLALSNLMMALASNRKFAFHSIGSLGVVELTAPGRSGFVNEGLRRLGVPPAARKYFALHSTLDIEHSKAWNREILCPLVAADPRLGRAIAEGALMRLRAGERCFARYREDLGFNS